jgi:peptidoglycan-associated lipoprotein
MIRRPVVLVVALFLTIGGLDACRKKVQPEPTPSSASTTDDAAQRRADSIAAATSARRRADSLAALGNRSGDAQRAQAELTQTLSQRIYFDYDKDQLRDDAREALDAKAVILIANPGVSLNITGHTDERGTAEYNLALGQKRAAQAKRYLESKGVVGARLNTQSLGDSQPASTGTDEGSYQQNRRAEFEIRNGGALMRPRS